MDSKKYTELISQFLKERHDRWTGDRTDYNILHDFVMRLDLPVGDRLATEAAITTILNLAKER